MKHAQALQEQQHRYARTAKPTNTPQQAQPETTSWQLYLIVGIIVAGVLMLAAKIFGIF